MAFPLSPAPSYYSDATHNNRSGIYYVGGTVGVALSQATPTAYSVRDYYGNVVETGSVSGSTLNLVGPFNPGWYRVYMTGANTDALFGPSYGAWTFIVVPNDPRFPTNPAPSFATGFGGGEDHDPVMKGVLGMGLDRVQISDVTTGTGIDGIGNAQRAAGWSDTYWYSPSDAAFDANRRPAGKYLQFPNKTYDLLALPAGSGNYLECYCKDGTVDGGSVFVSVTPTGGQTASIVVSYPTSSTVVETWNVTTSADAVTQINDNTTGSNYIRVFVPGGNGLTPAALSTTAIGNTHYNGTVSCVASLSSSGYLYFEGPINEPSLDAITVHHMKLFQAAVHAGNPDAKAIGPCPVDIKQLSGAPSWDSFLSAGGANYCDEFSFHAYNSQTNGDINLGRTSWQTFLNFLKGYGADTKRRWHTEATHVFTSVYGVYHPRRSKVPILQTLVAEQYGLPRERNLVWYDISHGFWSYPAWVGTNSGPAPYAALYRTLAAETFGMTHYHRLDFGSEAANRVWLGSLYVTNKNSLGASCLILAMGSYMPGATVDLTITGTTSPITYVDGFGNTAIASQSLGRVTIPTSDIPTYVRLPAGVTATVYQVNDWGTSVPPSISSYGTATDPNINDDGFLSKYGGGPGGAYTSASGLPDTAQIMFLANATFQRVIVFCGGTWQNLSTLTTFTVDTWDGSSWTTQKSVDVSTGCTSFNHGSDSNGEGCGQETYWPEQTVFDIKFTSPVTALGVRVNATAASFGGEPDAAAIAAGGQGASTQRVCLQEIMVLSTSTPGV